MHDQPIEHLQEKVFAGNLLAAGAGQAAKVIDSFVSWLVAGAGGAVVFLVANLGDLAPYVSVESVRRAGILFVVAASLTVIEKYLASLVSGATETYARAGSLGRQLAADEVEVDFSVVLREVEAATLPPMRWFVSRSFAKVRKGDLAAAARNYARCAQIQGLLALLVVVLVLVAAGIIVNGVGGG
ncbi:MAG TPA: hypothetical protein VF121_09030 [Thermoanaerobaculia bacterium]|nr:hypothetical protein [Thermoanaerobaculia bacterium]